MKILKLLGFCALVLVGFVVVALVIGGLSGTKRDYYYLDVVNTGKQPAEITVSMAQANFLVDAGQSKTFTVDRQDPGQEKTPREITIKVGGKTEKLQAEVPYLDHLILDVTGDSCIVAADFGGMYSGDKTPAPGTMPIKVVKVIKTHPRVFRPNTFDKEKAAFDFSVDKGVGEKLPESVKVSKGSSTPPRMVKLVVVPSSKVDNEKELFNILVKESGS